MAKHKEIEVKWSADHVARRAFNRKAKALFKNLRVRHRLQRVSGPDMYFSDGSGRTVRVRRSNELFELTSKMRLHQKSITVRKEVNVRLSDRQSPDDVVALLGMLGFYKEFSIVKDCDIYTVPGPDRSHVTLVWYRVHNKEKGNRTFVEVEVEGLPRRKSMKVLREWSSYLRDDFGLDDRHVSDLSLYEIYSGRKYLSA
jgi:adenylate cyclase class IV